jgi:hypothetical protein
MRKNGTQPTRLKQLKPDPKNVNLGTERGQQMLESSLRKYGAGRSILIDRNNVIIAGNKTASEAGQIGLDKIRVIETDGTELVAVKRTDLDLERDKAARELAVADNRVAEVDLDWSETLKSLDADLGGMWTEAELEHLFGEEKEVGEGPEPQLDKADELLCKWGVEYGQVWEIGKHRLMCGDCTSSEDLGSLLEGIKPDLLLTDPPYGISIVNVLSGTDGAGKEVTIGSIRGRQKYPFGGVKNMGKVGGGNWVDSSLYRPVHGDNKPFDPTHLLSIAENCVLFGGNYFSSKLPDSRCWLIWDKDNTGNFADAELAWTSFDHTVKMYRFTWNGLVREGSRAIEGISRFHPTQKPVGLFAKIIRDFTSESDVVCDLYAGSGTTILAAALTGRVGVGMEIDPAYCAVTLERLSQMGLTPKLCNGIKPNV